MTTGSELGCFLRARRGRLTPEEAGITPHGAARRVVGLKREEVAQMAGVSVDYYARLEQGRPVHFSASVLEAVGRALQLDRVDQAHLHDLAGARDRRARRDPAGRPAVLPAYERLVRGMADQPAFVTDWRLNVLLATPLALALYLEMGSVDPEERNFARFVFTDPGARALFADWHLTAALVVGSLRHSLAQHSGDAELLALIAACRRVPDFEQLWQDYALTEITHSRKLHRHPVVGDVWVDCDNVRLVGESDQLLTVGSVDAGSESEAALDRLAVLASSPVR